MNNDPGWEVVLNAVLPQSLVERMRKLKEVIGELQRETLTHLGEMEKKVILPALESVKEVSPKPTTPAKPTAGGKSAKKRKTRSPSFKILNGLTQNFGEYTADILRGREPMNKDEIAAVLETRRLQYPGGLTAREYVEKNIYGKAAEKAGIYVPEGKKAVFTVSSSGTADES